MDGVDRPDHAFRSRLASRFGPLALDGGVALLWLLAWYVARVQEYVPHASLWFPPAGLTFGVGLAFGWRGLPGIVLAATIATMTLGELAPSATASSLLSAGVAFGAVHGLVYVAGARLLGDSVEFELAGRTGDLPDLLRLAGRVSGSEMTGTVWTAANTAGTNWRAARP